MRALVHTTLALGLLTGIASCNGNIGDTDTSGESVEMEGAGGRDISEYWPSIDVPLSQNTRMLSYAMLKSEVMRATGRSWVIAGADQWERNKGPLGGADFVSTFADDLTPSQARIVLIRKMAFAVCGDVITAEAGAATRTVFTDIDPGAAFDPTGGTAKAQIQSLFKRVFLDDASPEDVADGVALLKALSPAGDNGRVAWRGLCAAYLGSMRFLTY